MTAWQCLPRVLPYLRSYRSTAGAAFLIVVLSSLLGLLTPWPMKILIDSVLSDHPLPSLIAPWAPEPDQIGAVPLLIAVVAGGLLLTGCQRAIDLLNSYVQTKLDHQMQLDFRSDLFQHAQRLSLAFHADRRIGDFLARIGSQTASIGPVAMAYLPLTQSLVTLVGMFWVAYTLDAQLALLSLVVVPFVYYSIGYYSSRIEPRVRQVRQMEADSLSILSETMSMLRVVLAFGGQQREYHRFRNQSRDALDSRLKLTLRQTVFSFVVNLTTALGTSLVIAVGAYHVLQGDLTIGLLLVVITYIGSIYTPLQVISGTIGSLQEKFVDLRMALEVLDTPPEIRDAPDAVPLERARGAVHFEDVSFSYDGRTQTLRDINFQVEPGSFIAIVGPTGAGKTTLVSLLPRFYSVGTGCIRVDGIAVDRIRLRSLRRQISLVTQEPLLFSGSVAENIRYGRPEASEDEVVRAAEAAEADGFIRRLPQGYDTKVGELGKRLSVGERQRIALARAFLKDAPILILDEPTSSVDVETERAILDALQRLITGRTTLMIAHRFSTIRNADRILVLDQGRLAESGTHQELMAAGGMYRRFYQTHRGEGDRRQETGGRRKKAEGVGRRESGDGMEPDSGCSRADMEVGN